MKKIFGFGQKGFTLIELLIVIAVLGALAGVVVPQVSSFLKTANLAAANTEAQNVKTAAMSYLAENSCFPNDSDDLSPTYLSAPCSGYYIFGTVAGIGTGTNAASMPVAAAGDNNNLPAISPTHVNDTVGVTPVNASTISKTTAPGTGVTSGFKWDFAKQSWVKP